MCCQEMFLRMNVYVVEGSLCLGLSLSELKKDSLDYKDSLVLLNKCINKLLLSNEKWGE